MAEGRGRGPLGIAWPVHGKGRGRKNWECVLRSCRDRKALKKSEPGTGSSGLTLRGCKHNWEACEKCSGGLREICHTILHALLRDPNTAQSGGRCGNPALHSRTACPIESAEPSGSVRKHRRRATVIFHSQPRGPWAAAKGGAHENGILKSKALPNLLQTFKLLHTAPTGTHSALFTRATGGGLP